MPDQVPTWNSVAVHCIGHLERSPQGDMRNLSDRQSADAERLLLPKTPWLAAKMDPDVLDRMMRRIAPFRLRIEEIRSTWKPSRNEPDGVRLAAAAGLAGRDCGTTRRDWLHRCAGAT